MSDFLTQPVAELAVHAYAPMLAVNQENLDLQADAAQALDLLLDERACGRSLRRRVDVGNGQDTHWKNFK